AALLDPQAELGLEAVDRLVAHQGEVTAGLRHLHLDGGDGVRTLLGGAEEALAAEERVGEGGDEVVLPPRPRLPAAGALYPELLRLADDGRVRDGRHRLVAVAVGRGIARPGPGRSGEEGDEEKQAVRPRRVHGVARVEGGRQAAVYGEHGQDATTGDAVTNAPRRSPVYQSRPRPPGLPLRPAPE